MSTLLVLLGLTFYQNWHTYHSDIIKYEKTNSYLTCSEPNGECPKATQKTLKEAKAEKKITVNQLLKAGQKTKLSIPIEEINAALKGIKSPDSLTAKNEAVLNTDGNKESQIEMSGNSEIQKSKHEPKIDVSDTPLDKLLTPAPHAEINTASPYAINPAAYYGPANEEIIEAKLHDIENGVAENSPSVISAEEIRFASDENQISIDQSSTEIINRINQKYRNHKIRVTGFGIDENDAITMTLIALEAIDQGLILEDVRAVSDKDKRMVLIEVLNEI